KPSGSALTVEYRVPRGLAAELGEQVGQLGSQDLFSVVDDPSHDFARRKDRVDQPGRLPEPHQAVVRVGFLGRFEPRPDFGAPPAQLGLATKPFLYAASTAAAARAATTDTAVVNVALNNKLKQQILVTGQGMTLYLWLSDPRDTPTCVDDPDLHCSAVWPPYRSAAPPAAGPGVNAALLKT